MFSGSRADPRHCPGRHQPRRRTLSTLPPSPLMRILLAPLLLSYVRAALGVPFVKDAIRAAVFATTVVDDGPPEFGSAEFWYHIVVSILLVLAGGVFAG